MNAIGVYAISSSDDPDTLHIHVVACIDDNMKHLAVYGG